MQRLADRIKWVREQKGWSLARLGDETSYDKSYISRLESGKSENPSVKFLDKFCKALTVDRDWLLTGKGQPFASQSTQAPAGEPGLESLYSDPLAEPMADYLHVLQVLRVLMDGLPVVEWHAKLNALMAIEDLPEGVKKFWAMNWIRAYAAERGEQPSVLAETKMASRKTRKKKP